jgi:hypothetical protein
MNDGTVELGYNGRPWTFSDDAADRFTLRAARPRRVVGSFADEAVLAAAQIGDAYQGEQIQILAGGGMDSEAVAWAFERAKVPHRLVAIVDTGGANALELAALPAGATRIETDMVAWISSAECRALADEVQQHRCELMYQYAALLGPLRDRVVVAGWGEPHAVKKSCCGWTLLEGECFYATFKLMLKYGIKGTASFWQWSTELFHSWFGHAFWRWPQIRGVDTDATRYAFYAAALGLAPRPKVAWQRKLKVWERPSIWTRTWSMPVGEFYARAELGVR